MFIIIYSSICSQRYLSRALRYVNVIISIFINIYFCYFYRIAKALNQSVRRSIRHIRSSLRLTENPVLTQTSRGSSPRATSPQVWTTQEPYIPPVDYIPDSASNPSVSEDPPPIYATLDPLTRQKVLKMLQRAGIRRSVSAGLRSSARRLQNTSRSQSTDASSLVTRPTPPTLELQGMDHLAYDHEIV